MIKKLFSVSNLVFYIKNRFVIFFGLTAIICCIHRYFFETFLPSLDTKDYWFYSGVLMVLFSILFIEPFYTSPTNIITNIIPLFFVLLPLVNDKDFASNDKGVLVISIVYLGGVLLLCILSVSLFNKNRSDDELYNKLSIHLKKIAIVCGNGTFIYSAIFLYFLLTNYWIDTKVYTLIQLAIWFFIININSNKSKIHGKFFIDKKQKNLEQIGQIFSVQSKRIFLAKLFEDKGCVEKFDIVEFKYAMESTSDIFIGIVFDVYLLNQEKWIKIIQVEKSTIVKKLEQNYIYKTTLESIKNIDNFIGFVTQGSEIGKIKFEYSKKKNDLQEGDLLELKVEEKTIYYQVINGFTLKEKLENKNENGFIEGEAIQLGEWINDKDNKCYFQKFGWLPFINTPIYRTDASDVKFEKLKYPDYQIGKIPGTKLPCVVNLDHAISHHLALLGVTGSGKSYLAREIIEQIKQDTKVICVDFTGEYIKDLKKLNANPHIFFDDKEKLKDVEKEIAEKETEQNKKSVDKKKLLEYKTKIQNRLKELLKEFIDSDNQISLFELPDLSNTTFILEFTQFFLESIFLYAKENFDNDNKKKICIVLEEAHTIIPETNFLGDLGDYGNNKAIVNKVGQIALQGRKYGVGLLIIAQRTANVSKTILTQCNTVVCFQAFDETSFNFLGNYIGKDIVQALPNLKPFHAVISGKAVKSNVPMIINLEREVKTEINLQTEDVYLNNDLEESSQFEYNIQEN